MTNWLMALLLLFVGSLPLHAQQTDGEDTEPKAVFTRTRDREKAEERSVPDSTIKKIKRQDAYWYADQAPDRPRPKQKKSDGSAWNRPWVGQLVWLIIIVLFLGVLILFLRSSQIPFFSRKEKIGTARAVEEEKDIFETDFEREIRQAKEAGQYRLAIRLWYLYVLRGMAERELIRYKPDLTNHHYLDQLYGQRLYQPFFSLTRAYEYAWYGEFPVDEAGYLQIENSFQSFQNLWP